MFLWKFLKPAIWILNTVFVLVYFLYSLCVNNWVQKERVSGFIQTRFHDLHMTLHTFQGVMIKGNHANESNTLNKSVVVSSWCISNVIEKPEKEIKTRQEERPKPKRNNLFNLMRNWRSYEIKCNIFKYSFYRLCLNKN